MGFGRWRKVAAAAVVLGLALTPLVWFVASPAAAQPKPVLYLTFDDGPGRDTPRFLDLLAYYRVQATFFVTGQAMATNPDTARRAVAEGHALANHTWSHPQLTALSSAAIREQFVATSRIIEQTTGVAPTCYRPPYGATSARVHDQAVAAGLPNRLWTTGSNQNHWGLWDIDTNDWRLSVAGSGWSEGDMRRQLDRADHGDTVLMHDGFSSRPRGLAVLSGWLADNHDRFDFRALPGCGGRLVEPPLDPANPQGWHRFQIARLYRAYFGRAPDAEGWEYWSRIHTEGHSLIDISHWFALSSELARQGHLDDDAFVAFVYRQVLDREPDPEGGRYWADQLAAGMARGELMIYFSESEEFIAATVPVITGPCLGATIDDSYRCLAATLPAYHW